MGQMPIAPGEAGGGGNSLTKIFANWGLGTPCYFRARAPSPAPKKSRRAHFIAAARGRRKPQLRTGNMSWRRSIDQLLL